MKKEVYIFGHKNPDTDSVCAALSMAYLKNTIDKENNYIPMTAGEVNSETSYVLERFGIKMPKVKYDIRKQVADINIRAVEPVSEEISIKEAWDKMNTSGDYTVPVTGKDKTVKGIITTGDIARAYMQVQDRSSLSEAQTPVANVLKVLGGELIVGSLQDRVPNGRIHVAAAGTKLAEENIKTGDIAILTGNEENQRMLMEKGVGLMILCGGAKLSDELKKTAEIKGVAVILSNDDLYEAVRFINQSVPVRHIMRDIKEVCCFCSDDYVDDIKNTVTDKRYRDYPVMDDGEFIGMISKSSLLDTSAKKMIMVDHNEPDQAVFGTFDADVIEIVDHHKLGTVETVQPIRVTNMPWGSTCTIVASMFEENGIEIPQKIAGILCSAILSDTMFFKSPTCTGIDTKTAKELAKTANVDLKELWEGMLRASLDLDSKTEKEIFYQDYKKFKADGFSFGAGQVLAANAEDVLAVKNRMLPYLPAALKDESVDMVCLMITDVSADSTELIYAGANAKNVIESAFGTSEKENGVYLKGVMSRKKQLIPPIMAVLQK